MTIVGIPVLAVGLFLAVVAWWKPTAVAGWECGISLSIALIGAVIVGVGV